MVTNSGRTPWRSRADLASSESKRKARNTTAGGRLIERLIPEADWQATVVGWADLQGWRAYHPNDSRRDRRGFPDWTFVRGNRLVFAELKRQTGKPSPDQEAWLAALRGVPGVEVYCWRPSDWVDVRDTLL